MLAPDRHRTSPAARVAIALAFALAAALPVPAQLYQGNAATIRPGEIEDGMFAASNAFATGSKITVRNLESGTNIEVEIVERANGGLVLLLLAPQAASALGIAQGEVVRVDAAVTSVAVDPGAQASDLSVSSDPDIDPAVGLPTGLIDYLASRPAVGEPAQTVAEPGDPTNQAAADSPAADGQTAADPNAPPELTAIPGQPVSAELDTAASIAAAELSADRLLEPTAVTSASSSPAAPDEVAAVVTEPDPQLDIPPVATLASSDPPDTPLAADTALLTTPVATVADASRLVSVATVPAWPAATPTVLGAESAAEPQPPRLASRDHDETPPTAFVAVSPPGTPRLSTPPDPGVSVPGLSTPRHPPVDRDLVALLAIPEPTRDAVISAEPTRELPFARTRVVLVEATEPRPPVGEAVTPPPLGASPALVVAPATPVPPALSDPGGVELAAAPVLPADGDVLVAAAAPELEPEQVSETPAAEGTADGSELALAEPAVDLLVITVAPADLRPPRGGGLGEPPAVDGSLYLLQLGAFSSQSGAQNVALGVPRSFAPAVVAASATDPIFKVVIGPLNRDESGTLLYRFRASGFPDAFLIPVAQS